MSINIIRNNFKEAAHFLDEFYKNDANIKLIEDASTLMADALKNGNKIISCGNGGSMCDAMHFAEELSGRFRNDRKALAAISISDPSHLTCVGNDYGYNQIFSRYIEAVGKPGDILLAISTSGNSKNVIEAINISKKLKIKTVALTGKDGGEISKICDLEIRAPFSEFADRAQEIHIKIIHSLIHIIETKV